MFWGNSLVLTVLFVIGGFAKPQPIPSTKQSYPGQVVFLGDSITDFWRQNGYQTWAEFYEPLGSLNFGVAGHLTTDTFQRITGGIIDNLEAKLVVLLIGTNDLAWGGRDEEQTNAFIGTILNLIHKKIPGCKILLLGVLPRSEADIHQKINNLNARLAQHANNNDVFYLDMGESFATGLGQIIPGLYSDGVHLTSEGYRAWANSMNPLFFELLESPVAPTTPRPNQGQVVFLGDSITDWWRSQGRTTWDRYYEPLGSVNTGVSGDTSGDTIRRITNDGIIDNMNARLAVLKIGTNDLSRQVPDAEIISNIGAILNLIRERNPGVHILLLGILPRAPRELHVKADEVNKEIAKYASATDVWFLNMNDAFSYDWGMVYPELYWDDYLHLSGQGYERWAETMNPLFFDILNGTATQPTEGPSSSSTTQSPGNGQVVFLGDSITQFWNSEGIQTWNANYASIALNLGISGDTTIDTIRRISADGIIDNLNAELAVLKIGTNDLSRGASDNDIITNIGTILRLIKERNPGVKILLLGILPRAPAELHMRAGNINTQISLYANAPDVWFLDMKDAFSKDWGMVFDELYWGDYLHLGPLGYVRWAETMNPLFFEILNQSKNKI